MRILINGRQAFLPDGVSFQFVAENRAFTGSDSYSLTIPFPLGGCAANIAIFGHIGRKDVAAQNVRFDCVITDRDFTRKGVLVITEISEAEVKTQFLEGRSVQNFDTTFDEIYLNELSLTDCPARTTVDAPPAQYLNANAAGVALPWVNNSSGVLQNDVLYDAQTASYVWKDIAEISCQYYLHHVVMQVARAVGYACDLTAWLASKYRYLLLCNALPTAWEEDEYAHALPHWTLTEFFEKLEAFLAAEFTIDHQRKTIDFRFADDEMAAVPPCCIEQVVEEYTTEVSEEEQTEYAETKVYEYPEQPDTAWPYLACSWILQGKKATTFPNVSALCGWLKQYGYTRAPYIKEGRPFGNPVFNLVLHTKLEGLYWVIRSLYTQDAGYATPTEGAEVYNGNFLLQPIGLYAPSEYVAKNDARQIVTLGVAPATIDEADEDKGLCLYLTPGDFTATDVADTTSDCIQFGAAAAIERGEDSEAPEVYDCLHVAFWDGTFYFPQKLPVPATAPTMARVTLTNIGTAATTYSIATATTPYSLSLQRDGGGLLPKVRYRPDLLQKCNFSFLAEQLPNPRALFFIKGQRYLCEKLTATFTSKGRSQLIKGTFYRLKD